MRPGPGRATARTRIALSWFPSSAVAPRRRARTQRRGRSIRRWRLCRGQRQRCGINTGSIMTAFVVYHHQQSLCSCTPLVGRFLQPLCGLGIVLAHAVAVVVHHPNVGLGKGISLFGCFSVRLIYISVIIISTSSIGASAHPRRPTGPRGSVD